MRSSSHHQSNFFIRRNFRIDLTSNLPVVNDQQSIGQRGHFFQLGRNQQHRATLIAQFDDLSMDEFNRANVDASSRLRNQQQLWRQLEFAANDQLLLVAT